MGLGSKSINHPVTPSLLLLDSLCAWSGSIKHSRIQTENYYLRGADCVPGRGLSDRHWWGHRELCWSLCLLPFVSPNLVQPDLVQCLRDGVPGLESPVPTKTVSRAHWLAWWSVLSATCPSPSLPTIPPRSGGRRQVTPEDPVSIRSPGCLTYPLVGDASTLFTGAGIFARTKT